MELDLGKLDEVKTFGKKTFGCNGCVLWNELPSDIRRILRYPNFKLAVQKKLFRQDLFVMSVLTVS